jgi:hypothetical protein
VSNSLLKARAAAYCQASRVLYSLVGAFLLWRESDISSLGYWYTVVSWMSMLPFLDVGFTATAVDAYTSLTSDPKRRAQIERVTALASGYFIIIALVVVGIVSLLGITGRLSTSWHLYVPILAMTLATAMMAVNMFQISLLQAAGNWERSQYLPIGPYLASTALMIVGAVGSLCPLLALSLGQCGLSFGLAAVLSRELRIKNLCWLRLGNVWRGSRQVCRGVMKTNVRYYLATLAATAITRVAMFAGSLKMKEVELGDIGRMNQTLVTVISVCLFPINGIANRVVGNLRAGKDRREVNNESLKLISIALLLALTSSAVILLLVNQRISWLGGTNLNLGQQLMLLTSLVMDSIAAGIVPLLAYLDAKDYWSGSATLVALSVLPWVAYLSFETPNFILVKLIVSVLVILKIQADYRRIVT